MVLHAAEARRLLFCGLPASSHLDPMMPLAIAAREAGHDVQFATGEPFVGRLELLGFRAHRAEISIPAGMSRLHGSPVGKRCSAGLGLDVSVRLFLDVLAGHTADDLLPLLSTALPDLVVFEETAVGAAVAACLLGVPAVSHAIGPALPATVVEQVVGARAAELWAHYGRTLMPLDALTGALRLDTYPASLQQRIAPTAAVRMPIRPVAWNEPGPSHPIVSQGKGRGVRDSPPLVYLTLGRSNCSAEVMSTAIQGLTALDVQLIVALGGLEPSALGHGLEGVRRDRVRLERFVDQAALLPWVDLVVHHGGTATLLGAVAEGLPQLLFPCEADHFSNGDAVVGAGIGRVLRPHEVSAAAICEAARELLGPERPSRALDAVRREMAALPHPRDVLAGLLARVCGDA
jgi:UDP:flavonoid glycosyltransferase YjiC (YdhE family)